MATNSSRISKLDNLGAMFDWQFKTTWDVYSRGDHDEAEEMAAKLLMEPRLGELHQAGMHLLLSLSPNDYVEHGKEAVRLYTSVLNGDIQMSPEQRADIERMLNDAKIALEQARTDKTTISRNIDKIIASGKTMKDLQDEQIKEMHVQFDLDAADTNSDANDDEANEDDADHTEQAAEADPEIVRPSPSLPETQGTSQGSTLVRSQSTAGSATEIDIDDNLSLPDLDKW